MSGDGWLADVSDEESLTDLSYKEWLADVSDEGPPTNVSYEERPTDVSAWVGQHAIEEDDELEEGEIREGDRFENGVKLEEGEIKEGYRLENGVTLEEDGIDKGEIRSENVIIDGRTFTLPRTIGHPLYPREHPNIFQFSAFTINDLQDIICSPTVHFRHKMSNTDVEIIYHIPARLMSMNSHGFSLAYVSEINSGWYGIGYLLMDVDETSIRLISTLKDMLMNPDDWFQALPVFIRWCWTGLLILGYDVGPHARMDCLLEFGEAVGSPRFIAQVMEASRIPGNL